MTLYNAEKEITAVTDVVNEVLGLAKGILIVETVRDMLRKGIDDQTCAEMADRLCREMDITPEQAWSDWKKGIGSLIYAATYPERRHNER